MSQHFVRQATQNRIISTAPVKGLVVLVACLLSTVAATPALAITPGHGDHDKTFDVRVNPQAAPKHLAAKLTRGARAASVQKEMGDARSALQKALPELEVNVNAERGIAGHITNGGGVLSAGKGKPEDTVQSFVSQNSKLFGLTRVSANDQIKTKASYSNPENKLQWVTLQQEIGGIPVFGSELKAVVNERGELTAITNELAPGLSDDVLRSSTGLSPEEAAVVAAAAVEVQINGANLVRQSVSEDGLTIDFKPFDKISILQAKQVIFPLEIGEAVMAYQLYIRHSTGSFGVVVDAESGALLFRKSMIAHQSQTATYLYYNGDSPAPGTPWPDPVNTDILAPKTQANVVPQAEATLISDDAPGLTAGQKASPDGWITDFESTSKGNNVWAGLNQDGISGIDQGVVGANQYSIANGNGDGPSFFNRNFRFTINPPPSLSADQPAIGSMNVYNKAEVTNMFFWVNRYHDYLYRLGFTEGAGNFQVKNFGRGGIGNDLIIAQAQDGWGTDPPSTNNAFYEIAPDGLPGSVHMFIFPDDNPDAVRDSALDQHVLLHELTHGTSTRLVGNGFGLNEQQGGGLGEGWSDFFATSIMSEFPDTKDQDPDKPVATGGWLTKNFLGVNFDNYFYGIREFPYSTDHTLNPLTFLDSDPFQYSTKDTPGSVPENPLCWSQNGAEVHSLGVIWASILWQARAHIMQKFDLSRTASPPSSYGSQKEAWKQGNRHMLQLVTDGLKLTPTNPTFVEARDAVLAAALAQATNPAGWASPDDANTSISQMDELQLWRGFANRHLGYGAVSVPRTDGRVIEREPVNYYSISKTGVTSLPLVLLTDPDNNLTGLDDDDSIEIEFNKDGTGAGFNFYGKTYTSMFVNTNGSITFDDEDKAIDLTVDQHFAQPRISGLLADFDGSTTRGAINVEQLDTDGDGEQDLVLVTFIDMPETASIDPVTEEGNKSNFQIILVLNNNTVYTRNSFTVRYGDCELLDTSKPIAGISGGQNSPRGPRYNTNVGFANEDLSAYQFCNPELPQSFFTEYFDGTPEHLFDLENLTFTWDHGFKFAWFNTPQASALLPLRALSANVRSESGNTVVNANDTVVINIPLESKFKKANLTNVIGLITPLTEGVTVVDPVSDYGRIDAGRSSAGLDPFLIQLDNTVSCGQQVRLKVDFATDQGIFGSKDDVLITVGTGVGDVQGALSWPQGGASSGVVSSSYDAVTTTILLKPSSINMKASTYLKNTRTNEIVLATSWNINTRQLGIRRGQKFTVAKPMLADDALAFDSVPIPDAVQSGVRFEVLPTDPNITGPVGRIRLTLGAFSHPHIQDLRMTLSNAQGFSMVLLDNVKASLDGRTKYSNITLDSEAADSVQNNGGLVDNTSYRPVGDFSVFSNAGVNSGTTWTLTVADLFAPYAGDITAWSIELSPQVLCPPQTVQSSNFSLGVSGWTTGSYGDPSLMDAYYRPANTSVPAALVLNTKPAASVRVPGWQSPGVFLTNGENQIYRFHAYVTRSGQPNLTKQEQIPFLRVRAAVGSVMANVHDYLFNTTQIDPGANSYSLAEAPSTNPNAPSHYWVDLDPVDAPSLYNDANHMVYGYVENWSHFSAQQGNLELVQSRMERFSAPTDSEGPVVCSYTAADLQNGSVWSGNLANSIWERDVPNGRPTVTTGPQGVTLDSSRVQPGGPLSFATFDIQPAGKQETVLKANKLYRVRYHISSNTPSSSNPIFRIRARALRWADVNELVIGPSNFGSTRNQLLGREILPGPGTRNPSHREGETQGGYYDQYISSPLVLPADVDFKTLRFGFDIFDYGYDGAGTAAQRAEGGRFTLDSIEVREFPQR
ncbi:MAG: M36 family metallopeptidase [Candidatus Sumerlaeaceae bacterium]